MTLLLILALSLGWLLLSVLLAAAIGQRRPLPPAPPSPFRLVTAPGQSAAMLCLLQQERLAAITVMRSVGMPVIVAESTWRSPLGVRCGRN